MDYQIGNMSTIAFPGSKLTPGVAKIVRRRELTRDLLLLWLETDIPLKFTPGQYCTLGYEGIEKPYSLASAPHDKHLEIFIEHLPSGELTPLIYQLQKGDTVSIRPRPKGLFTLDSRVHSHLMVATVTGIAPFLSMLRHYFHQGLGGQRFYILHGASYIDELGYYEELSKMARAHSDSIVFVPTISRPQDPHNKGWRGETGRVNILVEKYIRKFELESETTVIYTCGHPQMIEDVKVQFVPQGFRVKEERFWK